MSMSIIVDHLFMVLAASVLAIAIGIPLGILAHVYRKAKPWILHVVDVLQTIPALALLGLIMIVAGAGKLTVIIGLTLYSLLPVVRNTYLGLHQVDPGVREAARGIGMTRMERIVQVEFPIAFPTILTGIRIAVINAIGTAVFAAFVGGGGVGDAMYQAIRIHDMKMVLGSTAVLMLMAVVLDSLMSLCEKKIRKTHSDKTHIIRTLAVILAAFVVIIPFEAGQKINPDELIMYDGNYSEVRIMVRMAKDLIEDKTNLHVVIKDEMSQVNNFKIMKGKKRSCDLMFSYDGTVLTTFMHKDPKDVPENMALYDYVNRQSKQRYGISMTGKVGFNNTYAIAVPKRIAEKYHLKTISDLVPVADKLTFGAEHEFFTHEGSAKYYPFVKYYGLKFKSYKAVDESLKYNAIEHGAFQITEVYATDGLNKKAGLVILKDDRHFFPEYNGSYYVKDSTYKRFQKKAPELKEVLQELNGKISTEDMQNMTYQVDVKGKTPDEVAEKFLKQKGLIH
ncbi:MAG: ABC transporter permease subunit [Eubacterium sp.]|jgi:osmoprotectant transport system permease protein|uniref:glycine betaine ABC transporter substrate-binding protein n=1 Tax=Eubacterium sp. F2 TaxID=3381348 RepID=UPI003907F2F0|nr:ABC transporter permease subunit [Eubacterium sp.]MCH4005959.1 ABC transporter permease subunit [Eubacterium sp.]MCH4046222.1 ABC transporter permease subunit [Eubacterium sp.]MCH4079317.1 ABC transporter permease subunit [Eubacterium sp.]MCH4110541.1 ABC transporter permease subunit [Eubacterium sp.]